METNHLVPFAGLMPEDSFKTSEHIFFPLFLTFYKARKSIKSSPSLNPDLWGKTRSFSKGFFYIASQNLTPVNLKLVLFLKWEFCGVAP